jgi:hypothetical protein
VDRDDDLGDEGLADFASLLIGDDSFMDDIPVDAAQFEGGVDNSIVDLMVDDDIEPLPFDDKSFAVEVSKYIPSIKPFETTLEAFKRLASGHPWVPFKDPKDKKTAIDEAEYQLFDSMRSSSSAQTSNQSIATYVQYRYNRSL